MLVQRLWVDFRPLGEVSGKVLVSLSSHSQKERIPSPLIGGGLANPSEHFPTLFSG